jgi:hypothetical protein
VLSVSASGSSDSSRPCAIVRPNRRRISAWLPWIAGTRMCEVVVGVPATSRVRVVADADLLERRR